MGSPDYRNQNPIDDASCATSGLHAVSVLSSSHLTSRTETTTWTHMPLTVNPRALYSLWIIFILPQQYHMEEKWGVREGQKSFGSFSISQIQAPGKQWVSFRWQVEWVPLSPAGGHCPLLSLTGMATALWMQQFFLHFFSLKQNSPNRQNSVWNLNASHNANRRTTHIEWLGLERTLKVI